MIARQAAILFGLAGVAVTQPVLDLLGRNPAFFVAGNYSSSQILAFALVVALVPWGVAQALTLLATAAGARVGAVAFRVFEVVFTAAFGLALASTLGLTETAVAVGVAAALAVAVLVAEVRSGSARRFLSYLAVGNVAFVALFLVASPTAELVAGAGGPVDRGSVSVPPLSGPVVVVVLDEFPLTTILAPDGSINAERYPNLAQLARETTWFRNASTESTTTYLSVPSILTGIRAGEDDLPTSQDHPRNLFTLFGDEYPINRYEVITDLCPPELCTPPPREPLGQAIDDAWVAYQHRVLPESLSEGLPAIDQGWGNFGEVDGLGDEGSGAGSDGDASGEGGDDTEGDEAGGESMTPRDQAMEQWRDVMSDDVGPPGQAAAFRRRVAEIGDEPSVNLIHVALPHNPWALSPTVEDLVKTRRVNQVPDDPADPNYEFAHRQLYQLQALQMGAVDTLVGEMVGHLKDEGAWDGTTLVLLSDHGVDISPPGVGRQLSPDSQEELLRIPLFIKAPGQQSGDVRDDPATTIDVLPSMIDLLGIETDWDFDGHSLFDGSEPGYDRLLDSPTFAPAREVARRHARDFPGLDWEALAAVGDARELVGMPVDQLDIGAGSSLDVRLDEVDLLADLPPGGPVPNLLSGRIGGTDERPPELIVALNGRIAGLAGGYSLDEASGRWKFSALLADFFQTGTNDVTLYEIDDIHTGPILHPLSPY